MSKHRLIFILGKSGTGKDTIVDYLVEHYRAHRVSSYTTRPMRDCEVNEREHTFLKVCEVYPGPKEWCEHRSMQLLAETEYGGFFYFATREQLLYEHTPISVTTPVKQLKKQKPMKPIDAGRPVVYIIDERGMLDIFNNIETLEWFGQNFDVECWLVLRKNTDGIDAKRTDRDKDRKKTPYHLIDHVIQNDYDLDYLYSRIDAIMKRGTPVRNKE